MPLSWVTSDCTESGQWSLEPRRCSHLHTPAHVAHLLSRRFFDLLKSSGHKISPRASLVSLAPCGGIDAEPAKGATAFKFQVKYREPGAAGPSELNVFVKAQSERKITLLMKAITCVFVPENREVGGPCVCCRVPT
jgi:hypothetical protein